MHARSNPQPDKPPRFATAFFRSPAIPRPAWTGILLLTAMAYAWPLGASADGGLLDLGSLHGGDYVTANGISADGTVVVGDATDAAADNANRAFRWTAAGGMESLGTLNSGLDSYAWGVSGDGSVVVGMASDGAAGNANRAFRWTAAGGMESLGTLNGGIHSAAYGVSADGSVVVGVTNDGAAGNYSRAFRWTATSGMVNLGTLNGGSSSYAFGVNADGNVVVGQATDGAAFDEWRAFRWTAAGGMESLGTLNGGIDSFAYGVSGDGSVVVGTTSDGAAGYEYRAFRWTAASGMQSLGNLNGGDYSDAYGISADGKVVVGTADDGAAGNVSRGFRWTQSTGMQSVEDWLRASGVAVPADMTWVATATNADGTVVVGQLRDDHRVYIAWSGRGLVVLPEVAQSLGSTSAVSGAALDSASMVLHGAHGRPLARRVAPGQSCMWLAGDWGRDDHAVRDGDLGLAELGGCRRFDDAQVDLAVGHTWAKQHLFRDGKADYDGTYLMAEALRPLNDNLSRGKLWGSLGGYYHWGNADIRRNYLNAGVLDTSSGSPDTRTWALRARLDWENAAHPGDMALTPYGELSYVRTRVDGYSETGGGFPASVDARTEKDTDLRLGVSGAKPLSDATTLTGLVEGVHRFQGEGAGVSGEVNGLFGFSLPGQSLKRNWLRAGVGVEYRKDGGVAALMLNATSEGSTPSAWLAASYQRAF
jgi:probable HAF family extracellular repeat protein